MIGALLAASGERSSDRVSGWIVLAVVPVFIWLFTFRPNIVLTNSTLEIQNPFRFHRVPLADVRDTSLLNTGLRIRLVDGQEVVT